MSLSTRMQNHTLPVEDESLKNSRLLLQVFGNALRNKLCERGFRVIKITDDIRKTHGFTKTCEEVLVAPNMRSFYNAAMLDNVRASRLVDIDLALHYPDEYDDLN